MNSVISLVYLQVVHDSVEHLWESLCVCILNSGTVNVFTPASISGCSDQLRESILGVAKASAQLERVKLQQQIADKQCKQNLAQAAWA